MMHDSGMYNLSNDTWFWNVQPVPMVILQYSTNSNGDYVMYNLSNDAWFWNVQPK